MSAAGSGRTRTRIAPLEACWSEPEPTDPALVDDLTRALRLPGPVCEVLVRRGVTDVEAAKSFLRPRLEQLHDPGLLADGARAGERIARAVRGGETVLVHGDYDVDGICATALLTRWLRGLGADVEPFVPHRVRDGYDLSEAGLERARRVDARLIVTADCGTVAHGAVDAANAAGIDVVVTDHHTVAGVLPAAVAVVNPQRPDCPYPDKGLCGAGLAYKICELSARALGAPSAALVEYLDLVALATVADLVPLRGENRILVYYGLRRFAASRVPGIEALLRVSGVASDEVTAGQLGYRIGPRINAAGRVGDSADALRLLLTDDEVEAEALSARLDEMNTRRRDEDERTLEQALEQLEATYDPDRDYGVVLAGDGWHPGVIGIAASRIVERIHRPVVLVALSGMTGRGSARSIPGFHLYEAIVECAEHLGRYGGHSQAAGMDVARDALPAFREAFNRAARARLAAEQLRPSLRPDLELSIPEIDLQLVHWMRYLGPHGVGNPGPLFLSRNVALDAPKVVGERHVKTRLVHERHRLDAIGFGLVDRYPVESLASGPHDVLFRVERNEWQGRVTPQAKLVDVRPSAGES